MKQAIALFLLFGCVFARNIKFDDCGNGELISVDVEPCSSEPCVFVKGTPVTLSAKFVANHDTADVELKATVDLGGISIDYPVDKDACNYLKCPLVKGKEYTLVYPVPVMSGLAAMRTKMKWLLIGRENQKTLGCAEAEIEVKS